MKVISFEDFQGSDKLCEYCPLPEGSKGARCYGGQPVMCEGSHCAEAYEWYLDNWEDELSEENTKMLYQHSANDNMHQQLLTHFWVPTDWLSAYLQPDEIVEEFMKEYTSDESTNVYAAAALENKIVYEKTETPRKEGN